VSKSRTKQEPEKGYAVERVYLGLDYDPEKVDAIKFLDVMPRSEGYHLPYTIGKEPPEGHVDDTALGRSIRDRKQVLKPVEVDENFCILDGFDRWDIARRHGIPCPLVMVKGLHEDQKEDYIYEVNSARRDLDLRIRADLVRRFLTREEEKFKAGKIRHRSTYNKVATLCGVSLRMSRQIERAGHPDRWKAACAGETRVSQNGKTFEVKETDPDSQIQGLLAKLGDDTPLDQQEAAVQALRETLEQFGDLLAAKDRKEIRDRADAADQRVRQRRAALELARSETNRQPAHDEPDAGQGGQAQQVRSVAEVLEEVEAEPEVGDLDQRPFTYAVSVYLEQRLLPRDELTPEEEWAARVGRVAERCKVSVDDLIRLRLRRASSLDAALQALDRLFLACGVAPHLLYDSLTKHVLEAIFRPAA
jgi:hypothetical protein